MVMSSTGWSCIITVAGKKSSAKIDAKFDEIKIENGQILMYNDKGFDVFSKSGHQRFSSAYEKEVEGFFLLWRIPKVSGYLKGQLR